MSICGDCTQLDVCGVENWSPACENFDRGPSEDAEEYLTKPELCPEVVILIQDVQRLKEQMHNLEEIFAAMHRAYMGGEL